MKKRTLIYTRFNRFWHWSQAVLVLLLGITGFEIHGVFRLFGFERAITLHNWLAGSLGVLLAFVIMWHLTTNQWRNYIPTLRQIPEMIRFYLFGIFRNEPHPFKKTEISRLNPLQRLTYLGLKLLIFPILGLSGLASYFYNDLAAQGYLPDGVGTIAMIHTAGAFVLLVFLIAHVYLTTTGETPTSNLKAMITGWEDLHDSPAAERSPITAKSAPGIHSEVS